MEVFVATIFVWWKQCFQKIFLRNVPLVLHHHKQITELTMDQFKLVFAQFLLCSAFDRCSHVWHLFGFLINHAIDEESMLNGFH